jgi:YebC/PmpR family DNA-binding regulatory protein
MQADWLLSSGCNTAFGSGWNVLKIKLNQAYGASSMAGHSQFKNIMHRKGAQDKKRSKLFNKLAREITVAAKSGQPDPDLNPRLRNAIISAREHNMANDRIKRAIEQANPNSADAANYEDMRYEGYGPGGAAIIVEALTDNRNRTAGDVRMAFTKNGGVMGETNSVSFMFSKVGSIVYPATAANADQIFEIAIEAGADNVEATDNTWEIMTKPADFIAVKEALEKKLGTSQSSGIIWKPLTTVSVTQEQAKDLFDLIEALEDFDDVQNVFSNFEMDESTMARLMAS